MTEKVLSGEPDEFRTPDDLLKLAAQIGKATGALAGRRDVTVQLGHGICEGETEARFFHQKAVMQLETAPLITEMNDNGSLNLGALRPWDDPSDRALIPAGWGLVCHESAHALATRWKLRAEDKIPAYDLNGDGGTRALQQADLLEEIRCENRFLYRRSWDAWYLEAAAGRHLLGEADFSTMATREAAVRAAVLVGGRVLTGVLPPATVASVTDQAEKILGAKDNHEVTRICRKALRTGNEDADGMLALGRELAVLCLDPDDPDETSGRPQPGGTTGTSGLPQDPALRKLLNNAKVDGQEVRRNAINPGGASADESDYTMKDATGAQRAAAARLQARITGWYIPERSVTRHSSDIPPGRLSVREAIQADAQRASGQVPTATPWGQVTRRSIPTPPLRVAMAVDISGSMQGVAPTVREIAFRFSTAFRNLPDSRILVRAAGCQSYEYPVEEGRIPVYPYNSGSQDMGLCLEDLTVRLTLFRRDAARLVIVVSDAGMGHSERERAVSILNRLHDAGCVILWLTPGSPREREIQFLQEKLGFPLDVREVSGGYEKAALLAEDALVDTLEGAAARARNEGRRR